MGFSHSHHCPGIHGHSAAGYGPAYHEPVDIDWLGYMANSKLDMQRHIHESNLIEGYDDAAMDAQGLVAWQYLLDMGVDELSQGDIMKTQKIITLTQTDLQPDWRGYYRKIRVWVGGHEGAHPAAVPAMMADWLYQLKHDNLDPKLHHITFEKIHPFVDGNGRTGRMLMWLHEIHQGKEPTLILSETKNDAYGYYDWFRLAA